MRLRVERFESGDGRRIYRIPVRLFDGMYGNVYLVAGGAKPLLVDCGSGQPASNQDLLAGLESVGERHGEAASPEELGAVLVTHGHIDHFGGLSFLRRRTEAPILVHRLDRRVLVHYEEQVVVASRRVASFLRSTGIGPRRVGQYMEMYLGMKGFFRSLDDAEAIDEGEILEGEAEAHHVPGHCPGQVCLRFGEVLLTADHLLEKISPHLWPEAITQNTGLGHYLDSLQKVERVEGVRLGLGGHQGPIPDLGRRAAVTRRLHQERLERILQFCSEPRALAEISLEIFGTVTSYHVLLALLETGALVEHLHQRAELLAANLEEIEGAADPVIRYLRA